MDRRNDWHTLVGLVALTVLVAALFWAFLLPSLMVAAVVGLSAALLAIWSGEFAAWYLFI